MYEVMLWYGVGEVHKHINKCCDAPIILLIFDKLILTTDYTDLIQYYIYLQVSDSFNENENFLDTYEYRKGFNKNYDQKKSHY